MIHKLLIWVLFTLIAIGNLSAQQYDTISITVTNGMNISKICSKYSMNIADFRRINNKQNDVIHEGDIFKVLKAKDISENPIKTENDEKSTNEKKLINAANTQINNVKYTYKCEKCGKSFDTETEIKDGEKKICDECRQNENHNTMIVIIGILILLLAVFWRTKYWDRFKVKKKETVFVILIIVGILFVLLSWSFIRTLFVWLIIITTGIVIILFLIKKINSKKKQDAPSFSTDDIESLNRRIKDLEQEIEQLKEKNNQLKRKNASLSKEKTDLIEENILLGERIENQKYNSRNVRQNTEGSSNVERRGEQYPTNNGTTVGSTMLYAEAILDGVLMKVRDRIGEDTIFVLELQNKDVASLNIIQSVYQRILANSAYIDGCDKQITGNTTVKVIPGKAICNDQGKWIVSEKPIVIIS